MAETSNVPKRPEQLVEMLAERAGAADVDAISGEHAAAVEAYRQAADHAAALSMAAKGPRASTAYADRCAAYSFAAALQCLLAVAHGPHARRGLSLANAHDCAVIDRGDGFGPMSTEQSAVALQNVLCVGGSPYAH